MLPPFVVNVRQSLDSTLDVLSSVVVRNAPFPIDFSVEMAQRPRLSIKAEVPHRDDGRLIHINHEIVIPLMMSRYELLMWAHWQLRRLFEHEADESSAVEGARVFDPHDRDAPIKRIALAHRLKGGR